MSASARMNNTKARTNFEQYEASTSSVPPDSELNHRPQIETKPANISDLEQILRFSIAFHRELVDASLPLDMKSLAVYVSQIMGRGDAAVFIAFSGGAPVGMAAAIFFPLFFNFHHLTGQELWWYVNPEYRGSGVGLALMASLEEEAIKRGAKSFSMISLASGDKRVDAIYRQRGYKKQQTIYWKSLV